MFNRYAGNPECGLRLEGDGQAIDMPSEFNEGRLSLWADGQAEQPQPGVPGVSVSLDLADAIALRNALIYAIDKEVLR